MSIRRTSSINDAAEDPDSGLGAGQVYRGNLKRLVSKVQDERGFDLGQYRDQYLERRLSARLRVLDLHTYRQYADYLDSHEEEYTKLLDTLTINVTDFFRDAPVFDIFRKDIVPTLLKEKGAQRQRLIRAWSAGCATGEETYSIAMSFLEGMGKQRQTFMLSVLGTDLDESALAKARIAEYDIDKMRTIPPALQVKYLEGHGDTFSIKPEVARCVKFRSLNLFSDKPISVVDVIFCRNVFIYFSREQQARVLDVFWSALARGGYLVLGRSERLAPSAAKKFELVNGRERIYRKPKQR